MSEYGPETLREKLLSERAKGNVVILDHEGFHIAPISALVNQSADGLLYDLNRLEEVALTFLPKDMQWVNNFAVALVIRELKARIEAAEQILHRIVDIDGAMYEEVAWPLVEELAKVYFAAPAAGEEAGDE